MLISYVCSGFLNNVVMKVVTIGVLLFTLLFFLFGCNPAPSEVVPCQGTSGVLNEIPDSLDVFVEQFRRDLELVPEGEEISDAVTLSYVIEHHVLIDSLSSECNEVLYAKMLELGTGDNSLFENHIGILLCFISDSSTSFLNDTLMNLKVSTGLIADLAINDLAGFRASASDKVIQKGLSVNVDNVVYENCYSWKYDRQGYVIEFVFNESHQFLQLVIDQKVFNIK